MDYPCPDLSSQLITLSMRESNLVNGHHVPWCTNTNMARSVKVIM